MKRYNVRATVNYPETEADTPDFDDLSLSQANDIIVRLLASEHQATSFMIIVTVKKDSK